MSNEVSQIYVGGLKFLRWVETGALIRKPDKNAKCTF